MDENKIFNEDDMMIDFAEMTTFDFNSLDYQQIKELHNITEYDEKPCAFKFGKFDLTDFFKTFTTEN